MKKRILALAIAGALSVPQAAFAARDGDGMEYVSAAEGFYGSLRVHFSSNEGKADNNAAMLPGGSRLGVRGTHDLGHGLTGVYRYEWSVSSDNGQAPGNTRLHYVGLKGNFGEVQMGSLWENDYNWVTAATDIATTGSGNFAPHFRRANSLQYTSPNLNGFQGSFRVMMNGGADNASPAQAAGCYNAADEFTGPGTSVDTPVTDPNRGVPQDNTCANGETLKAARDEVKASENVDEWALSAKYGVRGFTVAGAYETAPEGLTKEGGAKDNKTFWALRGGYAQDNWAVNAWYGKDNSSDAKRVGNTNAGTMEDVTTFSVSGNIDIGKVGLSYTKTKK